MRLAAIDVGTNSVHMVIADVSADGRIQVVDRMKEMVRLGRRVFTTGMLTEQAMDLAVQTLITFGRLAHARRVERMRVVATSAVREARNGADFVRRLRRETGLRVEVISGTEEARLIFRAAHHALGLDESPYLLLDIGGGSVEIGLVEEGRPRWLRSLPLGAARLTERCFSKDPPTASQVRKLEKTLRRSLGDLLTDARRAGVTRVVGTSGAIATMVAMAHAAKGREPVRLHGARATAVELRRLRRRVLAVDAQRRSDLAGMDPKRVDLMPAAIVVVDFVLQHTGAPELAVCGWALREGVLLDLAGSRAKVARGASANGVRRRSVEALAARFGPNAHGRQVARLVLSLFDGLAPYLKLPATFRELVWYAALLHDIGHSIDHDRHHRHSAYLIRSAELLGFEPIEVEIMAEVARGHRKQSPKLDDPNLRLLPPRARRGVRALAALLRIGDALDRTHFGVVRALDVLEDGGRLVIQVDPVGEGAELELWAAERRIDLLRRLLARDVVLQVRPPAA